MDESRAEKVEEGTGTRRRKRVGAKREKGGTLVIKTDQSKYSGILKAMRSDVKLVELGADVRSIKRNLTGEMILELKRDKDRKGAAYKSWAEEVLGDGVEVRALTAELTLKVKHLDGVTEAEELVTALCLQCFHEPFHELVWSDPDTGHTRSRPG